MAKSPRTSMVDHALIHELTKLLAETGLTEIEIEQDGQRVRVAPGTVATAAPVSRAAAAAGRGIDQGADRSGEAPGRRRLADGRHRLWQPGTGRQTVHRNRQP